MTLAKTAFALKTATFKRSVGAMHQELMRAQRLPPPALAGLQWRRMEATLQFALNHTSFYRDWYRAQGCDPDSIRSRSDWARLPLLSRALVKEHSADFLSDEATERNVRDALTGGSTGEPLRIKHDTRVPTIALSWRMYSWWGIQPWDNLARVGRWSFDRIATARNDLSWWPTKQRYLDAGLISDDSMRAFAGQLQRTKPRLIEGYVGAMLELADFLEREEIAIERPLAVATTAAPLPATSRRRLESIFRAPVYDEYRGSEFGWMAGECAERTGLHMFADDKLIEVVGDDGMPLPPEEIGDIVITDLTNRVFPLIRYRTGDRGSLKEGTCRCGVTLPRMNQPDGRTTDLVRLPSGSSLNHRLMGMFSAHPEAVRLFQIHQTSDYAITIRVVRGPAPDAESHVSEAVAQLRERVSNEVPVRVEYVDRLPYSGGKVKYVISDVSSPAL